MTTRGGYFLFSVLLSVAVHVTGKCLFTTSTTTRGSKSSFSLKNIFRGGPIAAADCPPESLTSCGIGDLACYAQQISGQVSGASCSSQVESTPVVIENCKSETKSSRVTMIKKPYTVNVASAARDSAVAGARASSQSKGNIVHRSSILDQLMKNESSSSVWGQSPSLGGKNQRRPLPRSRPSSSSKGPSSNSSTDRPSLSTTFQSFSGLSFYEEQFVASGGNLSTQLTHHSPEPRVCVGNGFVLQIVQNVLRVFNATKLGDALIPPMRINLLYGLPDEISPSLSSPSCLFDADSNRWFHTVILRDVKNDGTWTSGKSWILLAVSTSADPTQDWMFYSIPTQNDGTDGTPDHVCHEGPCSPDDLRLGVNKHGVYLTTNEYHLNKNFAYGWALTSFLQANVHALSKGDVVKGLQQTSVHIMAANVHGFSLAPATVVPGAVDPPQPQPQSGSASPRQKLTDPLGVGDAVSKLFSQDMGQRAGASLTAGKGSASSITAGAVNSGKGQGAVSDSVSSAKVRNSSGSNSVDALSLDAPVMFLSTDSIPWVEFGPNIRSSDTVYVWKLLNTSSLSTPTPSLELQMFGLFLDDAYTPPFSVEQPSKGTSTSALPIAECLALEDCADRLGAYWYPGKETFGPQPIRMGSGPTSGDWDNRWADTRIVGNVVQIGSKLWGVWNTGVLTKDAITYTGLNGAYWVEVDAGTFPVPAVTKQGIVALERNSILAPSIAMKAANKGAISFTVVGEDYYPTSAFVTYDGSTTGELVVVKRGTAYDDSFSCYVDTRGWRCLWSVASSSQTDSEGNLWTATSLIETDGTTCTLDHWLATRWTCDNTRGIESNWATRISKISIA